MSKQSRITYSLTSHNMAVACIAFLLFLLFILIQMLASFQLSIANSLKSIKSRNSPHPLLTAPLLFSKEIAGGSTKYPFKDVVLANIGNPQALKQKPITYFRQVLSLLENNDLLEDPEKRKVISSLYPEDVIQRAVRYRDEAGVVIGAYTSSQGLPMIRQEVADYISGE